MTVKYKTVITKAGAEKLAAASVPSGKKVNFVAMAVGDGGGTLPEPNASQTKLVNEVWRHALNKISQDKKHKNYVVAELVIPPETGGFWLREMGLYDDTGTLIAVGNMAESYKPELAEGSGRAQTLRMVIMVSDIEMVELSIDTTLVMATQDYVDDKLAEHEQSRRHPDATLKEKGFTQLSSATDSASETLAATPKAVKAANDNANGRVPSGRKVNGRPLTDDISVTAQDIFNGQAVAIGNAADLNAYTTPGLYFQSANAQASAGKNYPEAVAGSLEVYKHAGFTQIYRIYSNSRSYIRTIFNGVWTAWTKQYDVENKPTPAEIGALASNGNAVSATRLLNARKIAGVAFDGTADIAIPAANVGAYTKAETDNKYQAKGSYTPAGQAYTKAESDARFQKINTASLEANGWFRDTNTGMLIQYGKVAVTSDGQGFTFPVAFSLVPSLALTVNSGAYGDVGASSVSTTGFVVKAAAKNTVGFIAMGK